MKIFCFTMMKVKCHFHMLCNKEQVSHVGFSSEKTIEKEIFEALEFKLLSFVFLFETCKRVIFKNIFSHSCTNQAQLCLASGMRLDQVHSVKRLHTRLTQKNC